DKERYLNEVAWKSLVIQEASIEKLDALKFICGSQAMAIDVSLVSPTSVQIKLTRLAAGSTTVRSPMISGGSQRCDTGRTLPAELKANESLDFICTRDPT